MVRKTHHVVPNKQSGWDVKKGGGQRSIKHFDKKSEFIIHKKDGQIQNSDSHGNDPMPPKDKK